MYRVGRHASSAGETGSCSSDEKAVWLCGVMIASRCQIIGRYNRSAHAELLTSSNMWQAITFGGGIFMRICARFYACCAI